MMSNPALRRKAGKEGTRESVVGKAWPEKDNDKDTNINAHDDIDDNIKVNKMIENQCYSCKVKQCKDPTEYMVKNTCIE